MKRLFTSLILLFLLNGLPGHSAPDRKKGESAYSPGMVAVDITTLKPLSEADSVVRGAVYADPSFPASERAADLIRRMNFEEKLRLTGGWNRFLIAGIPRLGVRPVSMADASQGIRLQTTLVKDKSTSFPGMLPLASTWNPALAAEMSHSLADECRALGVDILLGPGANIQRLSVGGRNFEYMGEDPLLTSVMAAAYVKGLQRNGIIATPKHFLGNDQDFCRHIANSIIDERTLREVYLLPWERMIAEAGCLGIMTGNNLTNGLPCPMNKPLIADILRREYGFKGVAMTDWQNTGYYPQLQHLVLTSGETLLMPENAAFREYVLRETAGSAERRAEVEALLEAREKAGIIKEGVHAVIGSLRQGFQRPVAVRPFRGPQSPCGTVRRGSDGAAQEPAEHIAAQTGTAHSADRHRRDSQRNGQRIREGLRPRKLRTGIAGRLRRRSHMPDRSRPGDGPQGRRGAFPPQQTGRRRFGHPL